jgi:hypothetical protein
MVIFYGVQEGTGNGLLANDILKGLGPVFTGRYYEWFQCRSVFPATVPADYYKDINSDGSEEPNLLVLPFFINNSLSTMVMDSPGWLSACECHWISISR